MFGAADNLSSRGGNHKMTKAKMKTKPKPKPKLNNRRVRRRRPTNNVGSMVNANFNQAKRYMDPEGKTEAPASTTSLGNFTTVNSILRQAILTSSTADTNVYVIVQYTINAKRLFYYSWKSGDTPFLGGVKFATLDVNNPTQIKPLRLAVTIRNTAVVTSTEGSLRFLCMPQNIDWSDAFTDNVTATTLTDAFCTSIDNMVEGNNKTVTYTAWELKHGKKFIFAPVSTVGYNNWYEYINDATNLGALETGADGDALTTFICKLPYVSNRNSYDFTVRGQDACRYPANHVLAQAAKSAPRSRPGVMETVHNIASETAHIAEDVGHVFSSIGNAIPQIASGAYNIFRTGQGIRSLMGRAAPIVEEIGEMAPLMLM